MKNDLVLLLQLPNKAPIKDTHNIAKHLINYNSIMNLNPIR